MTKTQTEIVMTACEVENEVNNLIDFAKESGLSPEKFVIVLKIVTEVLQSRGGFDVDHTPYKVEHAHHS